MRVRPGTPAGGQFAPSSHGDPDVTLAHSDSSRYACPRCGNEYVRPDEALPPGHTCQASKAAPDPDAMAAHFRTVRDARAEKESLDADNWGDHELHANFVSEIRGARCWKDSDRSVAAATVNGRNVAAEMLDQMSQDFDLDVDDCRIDDDVDGRTYLLKWGLKTASVPRPVTEADKNVATTIYRQIGPIVAGNMDAKAAWSGAVRNGLKMGNCRMGRTRVDVTVTLNGSDLYDVKVDRRPTLKDPDPSTLFSAVDLSVGQMQRMMLQIGDNDRDALASMEGATKQ